MRGRALTLAAMTLAAGASAQPRTPALAIAMTARANAPDASRELDRRRAAIVRCIDAAAARAPDRLAALRQVLLTVRLDRRGRATSVQIDPPLLSPGLSECLADVLLPWDQGGRPGLRAVVQLRLAR
jgi:hypothetical protein